MKEKENEHVESAGEVEQQVKKTLDEVFALINSKKINALAQMHLYDVRFTKFDDFESLDRADGEAMRKAENQAFSSVDNLHFSYANPKIAVQGVSSRHGGHHLHYD